MAIMKLADFTQGRDNNFNLIRIVAAYAVLVTHSFALAIGTGDAEPFIDTLGMTIGTIAVDIFFLTSGFLVTASLLTRQNTIEFVWARILRIFPALLVMLLLTVFGLGLFFTTASWSAYLDDPQTYRYLLKCSTLFTGIVLKLPGVFEDNPLKNAVNGSLWTMPYEVKMYAALAFLWICLRITPKSRLQAFRVTVVSIAVVTGIFVILSHLGIAKESGHAMRLSFMFSTGAAFFILKERIILSKMLFCFSMIALMLSMSDKYVFFLVYMATLAYMLFFIAYVPAGVIRKYNGFGDYSYGVYIYAFPVQQSIAALLPGISVLPMLIISSIITFIFSALSWHFLEKHALKLKESYVRQTRKLFRVT